MGGLLGANRSAGQKVLLLRKLFLANDLAILKAFVQKQKAVFLPLERLEAIETAPTKEKENIQRELRGAEVGTLTKADFATDGVNVGDVKGSMPVPSRHRGDKNIGGDFPLR
jgi:hypothetical protein